MLSKIISSILVLLLSSCSLQKISPNDIPKHYMRETYTEIFSQLPEEMPESFYQSYDSKQFSQIAALNSLVEQDIIFLD